MTAKRSRLGDWTTFEVVLATVVTLVWAYAFLTHTGGSTDRQWVQAAMMIVLGGVFGRRALKR